MWQVLWIRTQKFLDFRESQMLGKGSSGIYSYGSFKERESGSQREIKGDTFELTFPILPAARP